MPDKKPKLEKEIKKLVKQYFSISKCSENASLYAEFTRRTDTALIKEVLKHTQQNQSQAAKVLGISRTTLRKKMAILSLLNEADNE